MSVSRQAFVDLCDQLLQPSQFRDYCPNGLQVEGVERIEKVVAGVTASQALIDRAVEEEADVLLVHHGFFWKGESPGVTGMKYRRLKALIQHGINLVAYHLPLDAHPQFGNNAQLAQLLGIEVTGGLELGDPLSVGNVGRFSEPLSVDDVAARIATVLKREPTVIPAGEHRIETIGFCTGAAQGYLDRAAELGVDAYLSGELSEPTVHSARELGVHYFAAGHHATERYGVKALGEHVARELGLAFSFIDIDNPA